MPPEFAAAWIEAMSGIKLTTLVGVALWSLGLYWGFSPVVEWLIEQAERWLPFDREGGLSSLISLIPFLGVATGLVWLSDLALGKSWGVSLGVIVCLSGGIYELGRQDSKRQDPE